PPFAAVPGRWGRSACEQVDQGLVVDFGQQIEVAGEDVFVDLMNRGVDRAELHHLGAEGGDEAPVGCSSAGGGRGLAPGHAADGRGDAVEQFAWLGQEGQAGQGPVDVPVEAMLVEDGRGALLQALDRRFGGEAEVEYRFQRAGDDVGGASAGVEV